MTRLPHVRAALLLAASTLSPLAWADIASTFDAGLEGWTGLGGSVSHAAGGYLLQQDTQNTWMSVVAPAAFHGNLSSYLGGTLAFDGRNVDGAAPDLGSAPWFGRVTIAGPGGSAWRQVAGVGPGQPPANGSWQTYATTLDAAGWTGNLGAALANVTSMTVSLEFNDDIVEQAGFDNFRVSAVPEPGAWLLMLAGAAVLLRRRPRA